MIRMMRKKSPGYDGVVIDHVFGGLPCLAPVLAGLFHRIVATSRFPDLGWTVVRPIPKVLSP